MPRGGRWPGGTRFLLARRVVAVSVELPKMMSPIPPPDVGRRAPGSSLVTICAASGDALRASASAVRFSFVRMGELLGNAAPPKKAPRVPQCPAPLSACDSVTYV